MGKENKETSAALTLKVAKESFYGTGKRKCAIAKVWLFKGTGKIVVNKTDAKDYFNLESMVKNIKKPLDKLNITNKYDCFIRTLGGGKSGQQDAIILGISRALVEMNSEFRPSLKEEGFLSRDSRIKERKKYGRKRARKGYQFRKR